MHSQGWDLKKRCWDASSAPCCDNSQMGWKTRPVVKNEKRNFVFRNSIVSHAPTFAIKLRNSVGTWDELRSWIRRAKNQSFFRNPNTKYWTSDSHQNFENEVSVNRAWDTGILRTFYCSNHKKTPHTIRTAWNGYSVLWFGRESGLIITIVSLMFVDKYSFY